MQILKNDTKKKEDEESNNDSYKHDLLPPLVGQHHYPNQCQLYPQEEFPTGLPQELVVKPERR